MRSRTRTFARRGTKKQDVKWAQPALILDQVVANATTLSVSLLLDADWDALLSFERVTLLRIRGWISIAGVASSTTGGAFWAIYKTGIATAAPNPTLGASYSDNDTLLTGGAQAGTSTTTVSNINHELIDVKTKRILTPNDSIVWVIRATGTSTQRVSGFLRCLWAYK